MELARSTQRQLGLDEVSKAAWRIAIRAYVFSRSALLLVGWLTLSFIAPRASAPHGASAGFGPMLDLACRWDCNWYMKIAVNGYSTLSPPSQSFATNLAFWPALPFLARYLHDISGLSILMSGVILVNLAFFLCLYYLYRYCIALEVENRAASFAVLLLAFAPETFLFSAFYGDALALLGMIGAMYYARAQRWWIAGLFAVLASASRPTGILVLAFLLVHACQTLGWKNFLRPWINARPFIPVVLAPAGHFLAMWMAFVISGDAFAEVHTRSEGLGWLVRFGAPWSAIVGDFRGGPDLKFWTLCALFLTVSVIPLCRKRWYPDAVFAICYFLLIFSQHNPEGLLHYAIALPTIYLGFAWIFRNSESAKFILLGAFASVGAALFCAWTLYTSISV